MYRLLLTAVIAIPFILQADTHTGNEWFWDAVVVLHNDNHCNLLAQGHNSDEISGWIRDLPVSAVQVSAYGAMGDRVTYPSTAASELNYPDLGEWDTLDVWRKAVLKAGKRFHVYLNTRGFKIHERHPDWMQQDAQGKGKGRGPGLYDSCPRPAPDGDGYLEKILLPMVTEISTRYKPGAFWVDGDHARTQTCYCKNCIAAWKKLTGKDKPPSDSEDPDWPQWLGLEQQRYDTYRIMMAEAAHKVNPSIMYASNHSWHKMMGELWTKHDPRCAPPEMDYYTADLSHGQSLKQTRIDAMLLSAEEETPYEIMHSVYAPRVSLTRIMQQGAITLSSGGVWDLWISGSSITETAARDRAMFCARFADIRKEALGRTESLNPTAVLVSESAWLEQRTGGKDGSYNPDAVKNAALALQDSGYGVDIINEQMLLKRLSRYHTLVISGQKILSNEVIKRIQSFADQGGIVIISDAPQLTTLIHKGVIHSDLTKLTYPDSQGIMINCMKSAHLEPEVRQTGPGDRPHLIYAFRKKGTQSVLHVTDVTSFVDGARVLPDSTEIIDPLFRNHNSITIEIQSSQAPKAVKAANTEDLSYHWVSRVTPLAKASPRGFDANLPATTAEYSWAKGFLTITIRNFCVHTALMIDNGGTIPQPLPPGTPLADHFAYAHYKELNSLESDFEPEMHGHLSNPLSIFTISEPFQKKIRLTEKYAATGRSSLSIQNIPQKSPHLFVKPFGYDKGKGVLSLDIRMEKGADSWLDFRTTPSRKTGPVGPSVRIRGGQLIADGKGPLCSIENDKWYHIEIAFPLDGKGLYSLTLISPEGKKQLFTGLPYVSGKEFQKCGWIGIVALGKEPGIFYIDNFSLELKQQSLNQTGFE